MLPYQTAHDANGRPISDAIPQSDSVQSNTIPAGTARSFTVPADAKVVVFDADVPYWIRTDGTDAAVPTGSSTTPVAFCPTARMVTPGQTISVITNTAKADGSDGRIYLSFYS